MRNIKNVSNLDLEEIVKAGKENELIVAIEEALNGDAVKNTSRENKVIVMSNINKFVALEDISKENDERAVAVGLTLLAELSKEDWRKVSVVESFSSAQCPTGRLGESRALGPPHLCGRGSGRGKQGGRREGG